MTVADDEVKWDHNPDGVCSWSKLWWRRGSYDQLFIAAKCGAPGVFFVLKGLGSDVAVAGPIPDLDEAKVAYLLLEGDKT